MDTWILENFELLLLSSLSNGSKNCVKLVKFGLCYCLYSDHLLVMSLSNTVIALLTYFYTGGVVIAEHEQIVKQFLFPVKSQIPKQDYCQQNVFLSRTHFFNKNGNKVLYHIGSCHIVFIVVHRMSFECY